jgi:hypothetical protein
VLRAFNKTFFSNLFLSSNNFSTLLYWLDLKHDNETSRGEQILSMFCFFFIKPPTFRKVASVKKENFFEHQ